MRNKILVTIVALTGVYSMGNIAYGSSSLLQQSAKPSTGFSEMTSMETENTSEHCVVSLSSINTPYSVKGETFEATALIVNCGDIDVTEIGYSYSIEDGPHISKVLKLDQPIAPNPEMATSVILTFDGIEQPGKYNITVTIDNANGKENMSENLSYTFICTCMPYLPTHRALCEEYTALWCGWCPQGIIAMEEINKRFRDDVVVMSYHNADNLSVTGNYPMSVPGLPSLSIDRMSLLNPYNGTHSQYDCGILWDVEERMQNIPLADIEVRNIEISAGDISFDIVTVPMVEIADAHYQLGYAITANGLTSSQLQTNYYSGRSGYKGTLLERFVNMPSYINGLVYDDVVVHVGKYKGVEQSLPSSLDCGEEITSHYSVPISEIKYCSNPEMLVINAFIIDKTSSHIVNSNKAYVSAKEKPGVDEDEGGDIITGMTTIDEEEVIAVEYLDISGRKARHPYHGIQLVRKLMRDGGVKIEKRVM